MNERVREIRGELKELKVKQKAYRKTGRFRVLGGLGDKYGYKIRKLKEELRGLGYKR